MDRIKNILKTENLKGFKLSFVKDDVEGKKYLIYSREIYSFPKFRFLVSENEDIIFFSRCSVFTVDTLSFSVELNKKFRDENPLVCGILDSFIYTWINVVKKVDPEIKFE